MTTFNEKQQLQLSPYRRQRSIPNSSNRPKTPLQNPPKKRYCSSNTVNFATRLEQLNVGVRSARGMYCSAGFGCMGMRCSTFGRESFQERLRNASTDRARPMVGPSTVDQSNQRLARCTFPLKSNTEKRSGPRCCAGTAGRGSVESRALPERIMVDYFAVQNPFSASKTYSVAVKDFAESAILAYECGYTEDGLKRDIVGLLQSELEEKDAQTCLEFLSIVWITLMFSHRSVVRWGTNPPVTDETFGLWKGFVSMIVTGYFEKRMAWFPIDRLQLEMSVVTGKAEKPSLVAERARIVYTTLEFVAPQFPSM